MDWATVVLILGLVAILAIALVGGRMKATKEGMEYEGKGLLEWWLARAREQKGALPEPASEATDDLRQRDLRRGRHVDRQDHLSAPSVKELGAMIPRARVLWVDDHPLNNLFERQALASMGIFADSYTTNHDAEEAMGLGAFDLVISDIGRDGSSETGWDLLRIFRQRWPSVAFVFYVSDDGQEQRELAVQQGATGLTAKPDELVHLVVTGLASSAARSPTRERWTSR